MPVQSNRLRYLFSLAEELTAQAKRVRDLIGGSHWFSDGHHKECLLLDLLRRHLPGNTIAARGFVIGSSGEEAQSREQDILILDTSSEAPIFHQGGLVIGFPAQVLASISVKTTLGRKEIIDSVASLNGLRNVAYRDRHDQDIWCGGFFFEEDAGMRNFPKRRYKAIQDGIDQNPVTPPPPSAVTSPKLAPDILASSKDLAFIIHHSYRSDESTIEPARLNSYECNGMATAIFLASLLDHIAAVRGCDSEFATLIDEAGFCPLAYPADFLR